MDTPALGSNANRNLFVTFLVVGVAALTLGVIASESISSDFSRLFTGWPTNKSMWLLIAGGSTTAVGLAGLSRGTR